MRGGGSGTKSGCCSRTPTRCRSSDRHPKAVAASAGGDVERSVDWEAEIGALAARCLLRPRAEVCRASSRQEPFAAASPKARRPPPIRPRSGADVWPSDTRLWCLIPIDDYYRRMGLQWLNLLIAVRRRVPPVAAVRFKPIDWPLGPRAAPPLNRRRSEPRLRYPPARMNCSCVSVLLPAPWQFGNGARRPCRFLHLSKMKGTLSATRDRSAGCWHRPAIWPGMIGDMSAAMERLSGRPGPRSTMSS